MSGYDSFLTAKTATVEAAGFDVPTKQLNRQLFPFQRDIVRWALRRGRAAIFADCGTGKTPMQLEWANHVHAKAGRVLILAPLAVAEQTVREGEKFGIAVQYARHQADSDAGIVIANYEMLEHFDPGAFAGVVIDESSILKAYTGATRNAIIAAFARTPYRLACTATPAPNDFTELGNHSEFLGIKSRQEMLAEYFVHDGGTTQDWRLKGHAQEAFWRWLCSWAVMLRKPSDLGYEDDGFVLPPLRFQEHVIHVGHEDAWTQGMLFAPEAVTLNDQRATRRMTRSKRVEAAKRIIDDSHGPVVVWCELNQEADEITDAVPGAVQVAGADDYDTKAARLLDFAAERTRVLVTKASIAGFGMNWQHCATQVFMGVSHSYEQTYQAIRRCWRFGQERVVNVHFLRAETESAITSNLRRKESDAVRMADEMVKFMGEHLSAEVRGAHKEWNNYCPDVTMVLPSWIGE